MPTFVAAGLVDHNGLPSLTHAVPIPAGAVAGDLAVLWCYTNNPVSIASIGHSDGTQLWGPSVDSIIFPSFQNVFCYTRVITAGDLTAGLYRVTFDASTDADFAIGVYLGTSVHATTPVAGVVNHTGTSSTPTGSSITPAVDGCLLIWAATDWNGGTTITVPASLPVGGTGAWATRSQSLSSSGMPLVVGDVALTSASTATGLTIGSKGNSGFWTASVLLLAPPAGGASSGSGTLALGSPITAAAGGSISGGPITASGSFALNQPTAAATGNVSGGITASLTVDGTRLFQTLEHVGVNVSPWAGLYSNLQPVIDMLVSDLKCSLFILDPYGNSTWISSIANLNAGFYATVYENAQFTAAWNASRQILNAGSSLILACTGQVPLWASSGSGYDLLQAQETNFGTAITSMLDYGRRVKGLPFTLFQILNETDQGNPEGPVVDGTQYARFAGVVVSQLNALGYSDVMLAPPALSNEGLSAGYLPSFNSNATVQPRVRAYTCHTYQSPPSMGNFITQNSLLSNPKSLWVTEWGNMLTDGDLEQPSHPPVDEWVFTRQEVRNLLTLLAQNLNAFCEWEAWDVVHVHSNTWSYWGLFDYSNHAPTAGGTYTPKKRYYGIAQVFSFVRPGWVRIAVSTDNPNVYVVAFYHAASGGLTIVGYNGAGSPLTFSGTLGGVTNPASLRVYQTNASQNRLLTAVVTVTAGAFSASVAADSLFTLSTLVSELDQGTLAATVRPVTFAATGAVSGQTSGTAALALRPIALQSVGTLTGGAPTPTTPPPPPPPAVPDPVFTWIDALGTEHQLSGLSDLEVIQGRGGLAMPDIETVEDKIPGVGGAAMRDVIYHPRVVDLPLLVRASDYSRLWTRISEITTWFRTNRDPLNRPLAGRLRVQRPDGSQRELTCFYAGGLQGSEGAGISGPQYRRMVLQLHASDPFWYQRTSLQQTFALQAGGSFFTAPFFPLKLGLSIVSSGAPVVNPGDEVVWPIWQIIGPGSNPTLSNLSTGLSLTLTLALGAGQSVTVDTRPTRKTVTNDQTQAQIYSAVSTGAATMWPLQPGTNQIQVLMGGATTASRIVCQFQPAYLGA